MTASYLCQKSTHTADLSINYPMETVNSSSSIDRSLIKDKSLKVQSTAMGKLPTTRAFSNSMASFRKGNRKKVNSTSTILKITRKNSQSHSTIIPKQMPLLTTRIKNITKDRSILKPFCLKVKVACSIRIKTHTRVTGKQANSTDMAFSLGQMDLATKVSI